MLLPLMPAFMLSPFDTPLRRYFLLPADMMLPLLSLMPCRHADCCLRVTLLALPPDAAFAERAPFSPLRHDAAY